MSRLILHEYAPSGNCYKIRLTAAHLGITLERRGYDILKGETRTPGFLDTVNPAGRIPVLQIGNRFLPESNAACLWLADGSPLIPGDRFDRADMMRWLFWEQYSHEPNVATLRFWLAFIGRGALSEGQLLVLPGKHAAGVAAMDLLDRHLAERAFIVGDRVTLADLCLYAYSHVAGEGGFALVNWPHIRRWLAHLESLPGHVPMAA